MFVLLLLLLVMWLWLWLWSWLWLCTAVYCCVLLCTAVYRRACVPLCLCTAVHCCRPIENGQTDEELAAVLADWVDGLEDSTKRHNSVALFLETKLSQIEGKVLQARDPNRIRTACAVSVLDELIQRSRTLAPSFVAVRFDIMKSMYSEKQLRVSAVVAAGAVAGAVAWRRLASPLSSLSPWLSLALALALALAPSLSLLLLPSPPSPTPPTTKG